MNTSVSKGSLVRGLLGLVVGLLVVAGAGSVRAQSYQECLSACEGAFPRIDVTEKSCDQTLGKIAHDILVYRSFLETGRVCRTAKRFMEACETWRLATIDALTRLAGAIGVSPQCLTVQTADWAAHLWPFDLLKTCVGDATFTDFHDYLGYAPKVLDDMVTRGLDYALASSPYFDTSAALSAKHKPVCDPPSNPPKSYIPVMVAMHDALSAIPAYQACMSKCRKPTPQEERLEPIAGRLELAGQSVVALRAQFTKLEEDSGAALSQLQGGRCMAFSRFAGLLEGAEAEVGELNKYLARARENGPNLTDADVTDIDSRVVHLEETLKAMNLEAVARDCAAEVRTAEELSRRREALLDEFMSSPALALEAAERFGVDDDVPEKCESTLDCPMPHVCKEAKCQTDVDMDAVHPVLHEARQIAVSARRIEVMNKDGLVADSVDRIAALEKRKKTVEADLEKAAWSKAVDGWAEAYRAAALAQVDVLLEELTGVRDGLVPDGEMPKVRACRKQVRTLDGCIEDLEKARAAIEKSSPLKDPKWYARRVDDALGSAEECSVEVTEKSASCVAEPESEFPWLVVGLSVLGALVAGAVALIIIRKRS